MADATTGTTLNLFFEPPSCAGKHLSPASKKRITSELEQLPGIIQVVGIADFGVQLRATAAKANSLREVARMAAQCLTAEIAAGRLFPLFPLGSEVAVTTDL